DATAADPDGEGIAATRPGGEPCGGATGARNCTGGSASAVPEITATIAPTGATSPAATRISPSTPAMVEGTSMETLSVSISNRLSPGFTASPAALNHFVILPSATVSPSC